MDKLNIKYELLEENVLKMFLDNDSALNFIKEFIPTDKMYIASYNISKKYFDFKNPIKINKYDNNIIISVYYCENNGYFIDLLLDDQHQVIFS